MSTIFLLSEKVTNGSNPFFLNFISLAAILSGLLVIISKNPIVSVLFLIGLFLTISGYLMMLGLNFIGLSYLLVYVGAVSILFLFILMLINVRISELVTDSSNSLPLAVFIGIVFNSILYIDNIFSVSQALRLKNNIFNGNLNLLFLKSDNGNLSGFTKDISNDVSYVSSNLWDGNLAEASHISVLGNVIYSSYPIWLIITSIILLLAMVGAIVITIKQKG